jgi:hypothetical protein
MAKKDGGPAFPHIVDGDRGRPWHQPGAMSLRDYFAGQALVGLSQSGDYNVSRHADQIAASAYQIADAMLEARDKD